VGFVSLNAMKVRSGSPRTNDSGARRPSRSLARPEFERNIVEPTPFSTICRTDLRQSAAPIFDNLPHQLASTKQRQTGIVSAVRP
jgi:hypothetical protein